MPYARYETCAVGPVAKKLTARTNVVRVVLRHLLAQTGIPKLVAVVDVQLLAVLQVDVVVPV